jgi:ubiquinone/menaquinone biosynthesis C-methylase UbiE
MDSNRPQVDYDHIAARYDQRFTKSQHNQIESALRLLAQEQMATSILEAGCGTGRWLTSLDGLDAKHYGLDLSRGMLAQARQRSPDLHLINARAEQAPVASCAFDLVYCVNALHHFRQPCAFIKQAYRLLRLGGALAVIGMNPHDRYDDWYVYHYFEGVYQTDLERFSAWETLTDWMKTAGFGRVECRPVEHVVDHKIGWSVLDDPFLRKETTSQLILLSDEAYADGIVRMVNALTEADKRGEGLTFPVNLQIDMLVGWVE